MELVIKALSESGLRHLNAQLASDTDVGAMLHALRSDRSGCIDESAAALKTKDAVLVASRSADGSMPLVELDRLIAAGDRLFYVAKERPPS